MIIADEAVSRRWMFSIRGRIINLLLDLQRDFGIAYLFISRYGRGAERISHRVAVMYLGQIVEIGPRRAVFRNPQHPYTRKLLAAVPVAEPSRQRPQRVLLCRTIFPAIFICVAKRGGSRLVAVNASGRGITSHNHNQNTHSCA